MKLVAWLGAIGALIWSALGWMAWTIAGSGEAAVVTLSHWLQIDPASTQWIAQAFALAGGVAQWLIAIVWLMGMGVIGLLIWLGAQASAALAEPPSIAMRPQMGEGQGMGQVIQGEIRERSMD